MAEIIALVPLQCFKCETPVLANADEKAWVCGRCGQGLVLDEAFGLRPLQVNYHAGIQPGQTGKPFWVATGQVKFGRQVYGGKNEDAAAQALWAAPRQFFVPAYNCPLDEMAALGPRLLLQPPALQPGPAAPFTPVTLAWKDVQSMAEVIVLAIEVDRKDKLKKVALSVSLSQPELWILP